MATNSRRPGRAARLTGRSSELSVLDRLVDAVRAGQSQVLVIRGEPGVGKTALLDYLAGRGQTRVRARVLTGAMARPRARLLMAGAT